MVNFGKIFLSMWLWLSVGSALLLGVYDVAKKRALSRNNVYWILLSATALTTVFLCPFLTKGPLSDHFSLIFKAVLVSVSWISGLKAMECLPLTTILQIKVANMAAEADNGDETDFSGDVFMSAGAFDGSKPVVFDATEGPMVEAEDAGMMPFLATYSFSDMLTALQGLLQGSVEGGKYSLADFGFNTAKFSSAGLID